MKIFRVAFLFFAAALIAQEQPRFTTLPAGAYRIAGTVVSSTTGEPLARARVVVQDTKQRQSIQTMMTGDDGHFDFHVPAGKFSLQAARKGFIGSAFNQHETFSTAIVTGSDFDTEHLKFKLAPEGIISGKVLDENGEPVRHAFVMVYREVRNSGIATVQAVRNGQTDDLGDYEIAPLEAGTYFLSVKAEAWYAIHPHTLSETNAPPVVDRALDVAYPTIYYGDTTEAEEATPIPLRGGDHLTVDVHVAPVPALHLLYKYDANNPRGIAAPAFERPGLDGNDLTADGVQVNGSAPGVLEITGLPAGKYVVHMPGSTPDGDLPSEMDLSEDGQEVQAGEEHGPGSVNTTVQIEGWLKLPPAMRVALRNSRGRVTAISQVDDKGHANFAGITPGHYEVLVGSNNLRFAVTRIERKGQAIPGHSLEVQADESADITVHATAGTATVEGQVVRKGKGFAGAMVVLVPEDPENHHELFRRDQSDFDGTFSLPNVIPGTYTILAIEDGWDLDWAKPNVIAAYATKGKRITIESKSLVLKDAVDVQPK